MSLNLMPVETLGAPAELQKRSARDNLAPNIAAVFLAVGDESVDIALVCHLHQMLIVGIDEYQSIAGSKEVVKFALGLLYSLKTAETLQVGTTHIGDHAAGRFHVFYEFLDVARMGSPHFYNGNLVLWGKTEECLRYAHVIVEVALCEHHVVFLTEHGRNQFLGRGLTIGSRDSHYRNIEVATMLTGQFLEGGETILYKDESLIALLGILFFVYYCIGTAFLQGHGGKLVAVERGTL